MSKLKSALAVSILSLPFGTTADETKSFIEFGYTNIGRKRNGGLKPI